MQLDDDLKQMLRELGHAINDAVSDSERISEAIAGVREAGFDTVEPDDVAGTVRILESALKLCQSGSSKLPSRFDAVAERYHIDQVAAQFALLADSISTAA